jgi:NADPH2:quinone reductase
LAIQLARRAELRVIASASRPESKAWVKELGAEWVVDHSLPIGPHHREDQIHAVCDAVRAFYGV